MADPVEERERLESYHRDLSARDLPGQVSALRNGFLPDEPSVLIEAGIRCIPLIEADRTELVDAGLDRLKAIVFKLKMGRDTAEIRAALDRLEPVLDQKKKEDDANARYGLLAIGGLLFVILAAVCLIVYWLGR